MQQAQLLRIIMIPIHPLLLSLARQYSIISLAHFLLQLHRGTSIFVVIVHPLVKKAGGSEIRVSGNI
jgi:hypothetical protein